MELALKTKGMRGEPRGSDRRLRLVGGGSGWVGGPRYEADLRDRTNRCLCAARSPSPRDHLRSDERRP